MGTVTIFLASCPASSSPAREDAFEAAVPTRLELAAGRSPPGGWLRLAVRAADAMAVWYKPRQAGRKEEQQLSCIPPANASAKSSHVQPHCSGDRSRN